MADQLSLFILYNQFLNIPSQALNITTHVLKPGGTFVAKVGCMLDEDLFVFIRDPH